MADTQVRPALLAQKHFEFPYLYKFPGQESSEVILYATREAESLLWLRYLWLGIAAVVALAVIWLPLWLLADDLWLGFDWTPVAWFLTVVAALCLAGLWYYINITWTRTVGILTNYRLVKIVQYGLFNHATQTLPLDEIVDTSVGNKKLWEKLLDVATFTARSSAASSGLATDDASEGRFRINKKYFYWENIKYGEDFENYLHKVLKELKSKSMDDLHNFRPFIGELKAERREAFMQNYPQYWS